MPASRPRQPVRGSSGSDAASVQLPSWVDLVGDPDGSSDGLVVTLALESPKPVGRHGMVDVPVSAARAVRAALVDCRSGIVRRLPVGRSNVATLVIDSGMRPRHADRQRIERRAECLEAARALGKQSLRDVDDTLWRRWHDELPALLHQRAAHVRGENARAVALAAAVECGDWAAAGRLMTESHQSLVDEYGVSCPEVDSLCSAMAGLAGVCGCRRAGGGFAGQVVAVVDASRANEILAQVAIGYRSEIGRLPAWCLAAELSEPTGET